jgi:hypothetical protein
MGVIPGVIAGIVLLVLVIGLVTWRYEVRRRAAMQRFAESMSMDFSARAETALTELRRDIPFFQRGRRPRVSNLVSGRIEDLQLHLFDYAYTTGGGKHSQRHRHSVVAFETSGAPLPRFDLQPEHVFHKLASVLGFNDIDFPDAPAFSSKWHVRGPDEDAVRRLFTPEVIEAFAGRRRIVVSGGGPFLVVARRRARIADLSRVLDEAFEICNQVSR